MKRTKHLRKLGNNYCKQLFSLSLEIMKKSSFVRTSKRDFNLHRAHSKTITTFSLCDVEKKFSKAARKFFVFISRAEAANANSLITNFSPVLFCYCYSEIIIIFLSRVSFCGSIARKKINNNFGTDKRHAYVGKRRTLEWARVEWRMSKEELFLCFSMLFFSKYLTKKKILFMQHYRKSEETGKVFFFSSKECLKGIEDNFTRCCFMRTF